MRVYKGKISFGGKFLITLFNPQRTKLTFYSIDTRSARVAQW